MKKNSLEFPTIRPPSEAKSLLLRVTRGCHWNRCRFCGIYPALGQPDYSERSLAEIQQDILEFANRAYHHRIFHETLFIGDADPIYIGVDRFCEILLFIRQTLPWIQRITTYARISTLYCLSPNQLDQLHTAGLNRVHIGLETGNRSLLVFHRKGQTPKQIIHVIHALKQAQIECSVYVLLGLGGQHQWKEHILDTAHILNQTNPEFIRIRRLWLFTQGAEHQRECPLWEPIRQQQFIEQTPEGTIHELKLLISLLEDHLTGYLTCDHGNNYLQVEGRLPHDKDKMLNQINQFLERPMWEREIHYRTIGSRI